MTRPGPSAICLECWRETGRPSDPLGYYDVPCLRHYDPKDADKPVRPITRADIGKDRREL